MFKIIIDGIIGWDIDTDDIREKLKKANGEDIMVEINSPGGLISQGKTIFNLLNNYKGRVFTHIIGDAASMATYISQVGEKRTAEKNSVFMIHNGWGLAIGDHREMFKYGKHLDNLSNIIAKQYSESSGIELSELRTLMDDETYYYGDEIQEAGFVDEIVEGDGETDSSNSSESKDEALTLAQMAIADCMEKISTPEMIKKDMTELSVMMSDKNIIDIVSLKIEDKPGNPGDNNNNNKLEVKIMTLAELKEKFPELYNQLIAQGVEDGIEKGIEKGVTQERERVKGLTEMRSKFKKPHSHAVIDTAISEGHDMATLTVNLMSADQINEELEQAKLDNPDTPANGDDDKIEMKGDKMETVDHIDSVSEQIAKMPGII